jgi:hypothetical protein
MTNVMFINMQGLVNGLPCVVPPLAFQKWEAFLLPKIPTFAFY